MNYGCMKRLSYLLFLMFVCAGCVADQSSPKDESAPNSQGKEFLIQIPISGQSTRCQWGSLLQSIVYDTAAEMMVLTFAEDLQYAEVRFFHDAEPETIHLVEGTDEAVIPLSIKAGDWQLLITCGKEEIFSYTFTL